jgi:hypothetical protein
MVTRWTAALIALQTLTGRAPNTRKAGGERTSSEMGGTRHCANRVVVRARVITLD